MDPALRRTLAAAGLPGSGRFVPRSGWVSRAWVGDEVVVRSSSVEHRDAYRHEAAIAALLAGSDVPHARHLAHGDGPDGPWYVSERRPGRTLHEAWPEADRSTRRTMIENLGAALRALHRVPVPPGLMPPWLSGALAGGPWTAYHPPVVGRTLERVEAARRRPGLDPRLLDDVAAWVRDRLVLFEADEHVLVHGDLHGSNVIVDQGRVTGIVDFAEAVAQPADAELDTLLRWCARPAEFPPTPEARGLDPSALAEVPRWMHGAYPVLFERAHLRERLEVYDMHMELAILAHHPHQEIRETSQDRVARLLAGHGHLDGLLW